jgi:hypothetical protein
MTPDEKRGYSRGYSAGRRLARASIDRELIAALKEDFTQRMMIAIAAQQIARPWGERVGEEHKPYTTAPEITKNIRYIAEAAAGQCSFVATAVLHTEPPAEIQPSGAQL